MESRPSGSRVPNRWAIAAAGVVMQVALGAVYAWSVYRIPLAEWYGASVSAVNTTFSISILTLGFAAFFGGLWMNRSGPRVVALAAGLLYGLGIIGAGLSSGSLALLYLTYGVVAGVGIGLGYIVPIATLVKWFPDRRGFITGIAVAGFGAGALLTAPIAKALVQGVGVFSTFAIMGVLYLVMVGGAALFMQNPPEGWRPAGWQPETAQHGDRSGVDYTLGGALRTWQWYALWAMLCLNVTAGIAIIAEADPIAQSLTGVAPETAALLVSIISIANGAGRFLWAWLSDFIGRKWVFLVMYLLQAVLFFLIPTVGSTFLVLAALASIIVSCYGGGFGTMPAFNADYFGAKNVGTIYGLMITAWGVGGVFGPLLISYIIDTTGGYANAFYIIAAVMLVSSVLPFVVRPPGKVRT
ncbi:MFS transporter [Rubrobacter xylanophilus]|uniref:MFS transporter n=1 Tax=Rubrobacter xylanophilus TaxID=49319 RepID=A0A510HK24_9ACTN|nr:OFA family MFS transporter [Rubrobacter xylanophilus]BBL80332.1 MFS transporter [Rubrobacter xylanophilus]